MDNCDGEVAWRFGAARPELAAADGEIRMRALVSRIYGCVDASDPRPVVPLASGDPTPFACFRTAPAAEEAVTAAVASGKHNGYPSATGVTEACRYAKPTRRRRLCGVAVRRRGQM